MKTVNYNRFISGRGVGIFQQLILSATLSLICYSASYAGTTIEQVSFGPKSIPRPTSVISFDNPERQGVFIDNYSEERIAKNGTGFDLALDRFSEKRALKIDDISSLEVKLSRFRSKTASVSFWLYINEPKKMPDGSNAFTKRDHQYDIFSLVKKSRGTNSLPVQQFSMSRKGATLGTNRLVKNIDGDFKNIYLWRYEPMVLDQKGWYQVVIVQDENLTKTYMIKPDGKYICDMNYMESQLDRPTHLVIGNLDRSGPRKYTPFDKSGILLVDDIKLYDKALTAAHVQALLSYEDSIMSGGQRVSLRASGEGSFDIGVLGVDRKFWFNNTLPVDLVWGGEFSWNVKFEEYDNNGPVYTLESSFQRKKFIQIADAKAREKSPRITLSAKTSKRELGRWSIYSRNIADNAGRRYFIKSTSGYFLLPVKDAFGNYNLGSGRRPEVDWTIQKGQRR